MKDIRIIGNWEGREKYREYIYDKKGKVTFTNTPSQCPLILLTN